MKLFMKSCTLAFLIAGVVFGQQNPNPMDLLNHNRPVLDAHNCYPYDGKFNDRIDRALKGGFPVGIEQDLVWSIDKTTGKGRPAVSHTAKTTGDEPTLRQYFFEKVRPIVEKALKENNRAAWPMIIVHFDFKDNQPDLLHAVWDLLGEYEPWITTAQQTSDPHTLAPYDVKPLLVLTEDNDKQEEVFFRPLKVGDKLRLFGSAHTVEKRGANREESAHLAATMKPEELLVEKPTNYRRWWNNSWAEVEEGGQGKAGEWTAQDDLRLRALVNHAHQQGFWIRFYTLDGEDGVRAGGYNFGSREAVNRRWKAAINAGVNLIATDQYEDLDAFMKANGAK